MKLQRRTPEATKAYFEGFNAALELAVKRMETANDETSRSCIIQAIRDMKQSIEHL
jgi:hypothetical protein